MSIENKFLSLFISIKFAPLLEKFGENLTLTEEVRKVYKGQKIPPFTYLCS